MTVEVDLREYMDSQVRWLREGIDQRFEDNQRALDVATIKLRADFAKVNELREQVLQERGMYPRRELLEAVSDRVSKLERLIPLVGLASSVMGAILAFAAMKIFGLK